MSNHHSLTGLRPIEEEIFEILFNLCNERGEGERVKMKFILDRVDGLSKARLTNIIRRKLEPEDYVDYLPYEGIMLTDKGYAVAKAMQRNHRIAEALLGIILDMDWEFVHDEACPLEHVITDKMAETILSKLGSDPRTPYGFPIPDKKPSRQSIDEKMITLVTAQENIVYIICGVKPVKPLLRKLKEAGVSKLGFRVTKTSQEETKISISVNNVRVNLEIHEAESIYVCKEEND